MSKMNPVEKDVNSDPLEAVKQFLKENPVVGEEFDELIAPVENQLRSEIRRRHYSFLFKISALVLVTLSSLIVLTPVHFHLRALGRIALIKLIPYWDWSDYYYRDCLVENDALSPIAFHPPVECSVCEDLGPIETLTNVSSRLLIDHYISQHVPVIVADGTIDWPVVDDPDFHFHDIGEAYRKDQSGRKICNWKSNLLPSDIELDDFFQQIAQYPYDRPWFAHWENCGQKSLKTGRRFYPRPYFITPAVDISFNNWVLISNRYRAQRFKQVKLHSRLAMIAQVRGSNHLQLVPQDGCQSDCPVIQLTLVKGEIALFNSKLWNLEYQPGEHSTNIAFIIQGELD